MRGRFLSIISKRASASTTIPGEGWTLVADAPGFALWVDSISFLSPCSSRSITLLGDVFSATQSDLATIIGDDTSAHKLQSHCWGGFIAITSHSDGYFRIFRDSAGHVPCYYLEEDERWIFASDVDALAATALRSPTINWGELTDALFFYPHFGRPTCLTGVTELLPGEEALISRGALSIEPVWRPHEYLISSHPMELHEAVDRLATAFDTVFSGLASHYLAPVITVSGGLDSAIIATEYASRETKALHVNFYTPDGAGDERYWARIVSRTCDAPLHEYIYEAPVLQEYLGSKTHLPRPTHRFLGDPYHKSLLDHASLGDCAVLLSGYGGDNIFYAIPSALPLLDLLKSRTGPSSFMRCLNDLRQRTGASWPHLFRYGLRTRQRQQSRIGARTVPCDSLFLGSHVTSTDRPASLHPWLEGVEQLLPAKIEHLIALIGAYAHFEHLPRTATAANIFPLLMAPIANVALTIPSWTWNHGGIDRSVARMAARKLPREIAQRTSKGTPRSLYSNYYARHRGRLVQFLADGVLASNGLIDANLVRAYGANPPLRDANYIRLLELVDAEIWCRNWA